MAQVPEQTLAWLYKVLHDYRDAQRTYSDAARALSAYSSLSPRTEVYTYENGGSALLLTLSGTLPVTFRGTIYRFPLKLWIPTSYPQEAPMVYITPGRDMVVRPGQHVDVAGRVYHPYLRDWARMWDRASIAELLEFLQQVFAKEPPVISKAQQQQYQRPIGQLPAQQQPVTASVPPQLPPKQRVGSPEAAEMPSTDVPPPRPPKPGESTQQWPERTTSRDVQRSGPPLPPLPHEFQRSPPNPEAVQRQSYYRDVPPPQPPIPTSQPNTYENGRPTGGPQPWPVDRPRLRQLAATPQHSNYESSPVSPVSPMNGYSERPEPKYAQPPPLPQNVQLPQPQISNQQGPSHPRVPYPPSRHHYQQQQRQQQQQYEPAPPQPPPFPHQQVYQPSIPLQQQQPPQPKKQPPPDLLSDPFEITLSNPRETGPPIPAPPIPPNPEKEHLLHALSNTLTHQLQQKIHQNLSALPALRAQQTALFHAQERLETEIRQLDHLDSTLASNEAILHRSTLECDRTIADAKSKPPPPIDDVLIAPTMVAGQLWTLCAEEAACREAMYVLQKAVDRGRVGGGDFVRQMRALGRECFLKMVLARKCARGLGLEIYGQ